MINTFIDKIKRYKYIISIMVLITFANILSIYSRTFSDWYRRSIFKYSSLIFSRISGYVPISIGEIMIYFGIVLVALIVITLIFNIVIIAVIRFTKKEKTVFSKFYFCRKIIVRILIFALIFVYFTESFNCFILYHTSKIEDQYTINKKTNLDINSLLNLYNDIVVNLNELCDKFNRDSDGYIIEKTDYNECKNAMKNISNQFELLKGYYPNPKKIISSDFMSQQYLLGIYFPFSMEANYNSNIYATNLPVTYCHELSHLKGYIREDEANFIAFDACINSGNDYYKYCGYLSVLNYVYDDLFRYGSAEIKEKMIPIKNEVNKDNIYIIKEKFEKIQNNSILSTEYVSDVTDTFLDSNLKINGVTSGINNYSEVVKLLLLYYNN